MISTPEQQDVIIDDQHTLNVMKSMCFWEFGIFPSILPQWHIILAKICGILFFPPSFLSNEKSTLSQKPDKLFCDNSDDGA